MINQISNYKFTTKNLPPLLFKQLATQKTIIFPIQDKNIPILLQRFK